MLRQVIVQRNAIVAAVCAGQYIVSVTSSKFAQKPLLVSPPATKPQIGKAGSQVREQNSYKNAVKRFSVLDSFTLSSSRPMCDTQKPMTEQVKLSATTAALVGLGHKKVFVEPDLAALTICLRENSLAHTIVGDLSADTLSSSSTSADSASNILNSVITEAIKKSVQKSVTHSVENVLQAPVIKQDTALAAIEEKAIMSDIAKIAPEGEQADEPSTTQVATTTVDKASATALLYSGNPLLTKYLEAEHRGEPFAVSSVTDIRQFYSELAKDAERISRIHLGLDRVDDLHFAWEPYADAHPSKVTGKPVALWSAPSPSSLPEQFSGPSSRVVKSECIIKANRKHIQQLMLDDARSVEYDKYVRDYSILHADDEARQYVRHYRYSAVWPTSPRDLAVLSTYTHLESDGSILISTISLPDAMVPTSQDHVRAHVLSSCCLIRPLAKDDAVLKTSSSIIESADGEADEFCLVTFVSHINPGGSLPKSLTNWLGPQNSQNTLRNARDILENTK